MAEDAWDAILVAGLADPRDVDVTMTPEWSRALAVSHLAHNPPDVAVAWADERVVGVFPFYRDTQRSNGIPCRVIKPIPQLYSGRGCLIAWDMAAFAVALLEHFALDATPWDWLEMTVPLDSESHHALLQAAAGRALDVRTLWRAASPYIDLPNDWQTYFDGLPKKFRWTLRNSRKRMEEAGALRHWVCTDEDAVEAFLGHVFEVEKGSWKEQDGLSITRSEVQQAFYGQFARAAARRGRLHGHVLFLEERPVAYIFGVKVGSVFHDLKESFKLELSDLSPGHVLKTFAFPRLIDEGVARYDFRGNCESYKMRWTSLTYERVTLRIESGGARTRVANTIGACRRVGTKARSKLRTLIRGSSGADQV